MASVVSSDVVAVVDSVVQMVSVVVVASVTTSVTVVVVDSAAASVVVVVVVWITQPAAAAKSHTSSVGLKCSPSGQHISCNTSCVHTWKARQSVGCGWREPSMHVDVAGAVQQLSRMAHRRVAKASVMLNGRTGESNKPGRS